MSQANLNVLERDVEQARARFANDLARLRSPVNLARFKDDLWVEARETKDELVEKTKQAAKDGAQRVLTQLTERAAANPAAALAIGAGLAWRLFHRPPIATLLVGLGLVGLLRTSPSQHSSQPYMGFHDEDPKPRDRNDAGDASFGAFADAAKEKVQDWSAQTSEAVRQTGTQIVDKTGSVADRASAMLHDAGDAARDTMTQIADKVASVADRAPHRLRDTIPDRKDRDTYLLGAAALASRSRCGNCLSPESPRGYATTRALRPRRSRFRLASNRSWKGSALRLRRCIGVERGESEPCAMSGVGSQRGAHFHGQATEAPC